MMRMRSRRPYRLTAAALFVAIATMPLAAQDAAPESQLTMAEIIVEPADPAPDTLCRLRVKLTNSGDQTASQLGFDVTINGVELPVYRNQLFMYPVKAGETLEIPLYNFWSTETSRPAPDDGKLEIEVVLREAQWTKIEMEDDVEVWTPQGDVEGLPSAQSVTLAMSSGGS